MKVLVTGGFGYLGSALAQLLKNEGFDVRLLARQVPEYMLDWSRGFDVRLGDIKDESSLAGCCDAVDVVVHTAAANEIICTNDELEALLVNGFGTRNIVKEAASAGVDRFIYFSTFHAYGSAAGQVITETTEPRPTHSYGLTHLVGEHYTSMAAAKTEGLTATSLRISNGYGAPVHKGVPRWTLVINDLCRMAFETGEIIIKSSGKQSRDFVAIADVYQALKIVMDRVDHDYQVYNVGGADSRTILEIAEIVRAVFAEQYNRELPIKILGRDEPVAAPVVFEIEKLKALGYRPNNLIALEIGRILALLDAE